ncbi:DUF4350 domain-containing protein [Microbacterium sp. MYb64]|uniref:DUF4350 domain-containing protein n=1 Tax=Microbacterium sp. MYb64 TaxID=1848691 RepID=UPI002158899F|nr:DUF4350 domain-containing protein [Microbacterium sp. MYb64]
MSAVAPPSVPDTAAIGDGSGPSADARGAGTLVRAPRRLRRILGWVLVSALVLIVGAAGLLLTAPSPAQRDALDPERPGPGGMQALAQILRQQGVRIDVVRSRADAAGRLDAHTTLVMSDPYTLSDAAVTELTDSAHDIVLVSPSARMLRMLQLGTYGSPSSPPTAGADCDVPAFAHVGTIAPGQLLLPDPGVTACFGDATDGAAVLISEDDSTRRAAVDGAALFTNEHLAENGNAALGLALLGAQPHVVWYVPSYEDSDRTDIDVPKSLADLTPGWVTPVIVLGMITALLAAAWRGRRFGPLVAETLPVTVRASETMLGRARLTAKAADAAHAADALRTGTLSRLAARLGLAARADTAAVADAAADRIRVDRAGVRALLTGPLPGSDAELVPYARRLAELESAVENAVRIERSTP